MISPDPLDFHLSLAIAFDFPFGADPQKSFKILRLDLPARDLDFADLFLSFPNQFQFEEAVFPGDQGRKCGLF